MALLIYTSSCTQVPILSPVLDPVLSLSKPQDPKSLCANIDWYEAGRSDGSAGFVANKIDVHTSRCNSSTHPVQIDVYSNGREAGLVEFCSATGGLEAGKRGVVYEKVCPAHLEPVFLVNYDLGTRIHNLESQNSDLTSRIDNLKSLISPKVTGGSIREQIENLRTRQAKNNSEILALEEKSGSETSSEN